MARMPRLSERKRVVRVLAVKLAHARARPLDRFPVASLPWPGLAAELPTVALGLHELGTIAKSGP